MQHIPHHNLDEIERGRAEMQAFSEEKHVWPDLSLSGQDIHAAFNRVEHPVEGQAKSWHEISEVAKQRYNDLATELNRELDARQAWFEGEDREISAVRCPRCGEMFTNFKLKEHPCL